MQITVGNFARWAYLTTNKLITKFEVRELRYCEEILTQKKDNGGRKVNETKCSYAY